MNQSTMTHVPIFRLMNIAQLAFDLNEEYRKKSDPHLTFEK